MEQETLLKKINRAIGPTAETMGYELVRVLLIGAGSSRPTLQIMAERPDGTMLIDDCSRLSQAVSAILDVEDFMTEAYDLEVSSPGVDRPLTRVKDFDRYKGFETRIELDTPVDGQKKFRGMLRGIDANDNILMDTEHGSVVLPFSALGKAKLVLTDDLIRAAIKSEKDAKKNKKKDTGADTDIEEDEEDFEIEEEEEDETGEIVGKPAQKFKTPNPKKNPKNKPKNKKKTGSK